MGVPLDVNEVCRTLAVSGLFSQVCKHANLCAQDTLRQIMYYYRLIIRDYIE